MFWASSSWTSFDAHLSLRGLIFSATISFLAGIAFGMAPAIRGGRVSLASALLTRSVTGAGASGRSWSSKLLVAGQVALSLVVFASAALLFRSLINLKAQDLGFDRENLLLVWMQPSSTGRQGERLKSLWSDVQHRLASIPGVASASGSNVSVLNGVVLAPGPPQPRMRVEGQPLRLTPVPGGRSFILPGFFATLGIPMVAGREFTQADDVGKQIVIINETMARFYFDHDNPIGRHVGFGSDPGTPVEVVGVVKDFEGGSPRGRVQPLMLTYFPHRSGTGAQLVVLCAVLRTHDASARALIGTVRDRLRAFDPSLAVLKVDTVDEQLDDVLAQDRLVAALAAFFGTVAVLLACLGLYGLISQMMARRTSEIGVRMALGATRTDVLTMVLREGLGIAVAGILVGVPGALLGARALAPQLFGVRSGDQLIIIGSAAVAIASVAVAAAMVPARRAATIDPMMALRES
jgi:predicted permease